MNLKQRINAFFEEIVNEARTNPEFGARLEAALGGFTERDKGAAARTNRRSPAAIDPFAAFEQGENYLREKLAGLSIDQLRDVLAQFGIDRAKLAMKWKDNARIIDLIVKSVATRSAKGDAFRPEPRDTSRTFKRSNTPLPMPVAKAVDELVRAYQVLASAETPDVAAQREAQQRLEVLIKCSEGIFPKEAYHIPLFVERPAPPELLKAVVTEINATRMAIRQHYEVPMYIESKSLGTRVAVLVNPFYLQDFQDWAEKNCGKFRPMRGTET